MAAILPKIVILAALGVAVTGCSAMSQPRGTASMAIADAISDAPQPAPARDADTFASDADLALAVATAPPVELIFQPAVNGVPSSVLSYAEAIGPSNDIEILMAYYADVYDVPLGLVRRTAARESGLNPSAHHGPYWGIMQILPATARSMGYRGNNEGLLNPDTNLNYAVKYLAGAYVVAEGNEARADHFYRVGYYYEAKRKGLLEQAGLR